MTGGIGVDVHFDCTQCGFCCRNTKIPLTAAEAVDWLTDGNQVQLICEARPWREEPPADDPQAAHMKRRSFVAASGAMPVRVVASLVANIPGDCPNLLPDMRCGIYERRPLVCVIYPAEINPVIALQPSKKACPSAAWDSHHPLLMRGGAVMNEATRAAIQRWRSTDALEADLKGRVCAALSIGEAALAQEGFVVYSPPIDTLLGALSRALQCAGAPAPDGQWRFVTNRSETAGDLSRQGAVAVQAHGRGDPRYQYIGFKPASPA
ncbi:MAG: YkgJ family cysteine cluster protein [Steroidobacteraceae bacterium]